MKGYKVFNSDWTCRDFQYEVGKTFEENVNLEVCSNGFHFCEKAADCFNYYSFDNKNKVAEIEAIGEIKTEGNKSCTDKIKILREISWSEVLELVNIGKNCTGLKNTGNRNTGDRNTGDRNTGDRNTGDRNTGDRNTGDSNTGDSNTGDSNTGNWNTGDSNTGNWNTGDWNTGNWNTGDSNTGNWNTGDMNTGNWNTGDSNTGDWNTGNWNTGCFNEYEHEIMFFDLQSNWKYSDWLSSKQRRLMNCITKNVVEWIYEENMTEKEKEENESYKTTGGYLKVLDESDCAQIWWDDLTEDEKKLFYELPNFNEEKFKNCVGLKRL